MHDFERTYLTTTSSGSISRRCTTIERLSQSSVVASAPLAAVVGNPKTVAVATAADDTAPITSRVLFGRCGRMAVPSASIWFGTIDFNLSNQNALICVKILPLSGTLCSQTALRRRIGIESTMLCVPVHHHNIERADAIGRHKQQSIFAQLKHLSHFAWGGGGTSSAASYAHSSRRLVTFADMFPLRDLDIQQRGSHHCAAEHRGVGRSSQQL
jgi:hypothetical protein